jgi:hypothetical protein
MILPTFVMPMANAKMPTKQASKQPMSTRFCVSAASDSANTVSALRFMAASVLLVGALAYALDAADAADLSAATAATSSTSTSLRAREMRARERRTRECDASASERMFCA